MSGKGITATNLPFWYNGNDNEFIWKVASQNCKCYAGVEKDVEYNVDVEFKRYTTRKWWIHMYITKHN